MEITTKLNERTWQDKVHRRIAELCLQAYLRANTKRDGTRYAKHVPYTVPAEADALVKALGENDEETAKGIFVHGFNAWEAGA